MSALPSHLIAELASEDDLARAVAATEIHSLGSKPALQLVRKWQRIPQLAEILVAPELYVTVGMAVQPDTFASIRAACHMPELADVPPEQDAMEFELHFANGVLLDILTTRDPAGAGAIARYLAKFGEGIQQVEFLCADVDRATELLKEHFSLAPVYPVARPGANGMRVNFFLVTADDAGGKEKLLLELYERPPDKISVR